MMAFYKAEGIVLRRRNLGEADRLVTVLTRDRGKITAVARGARRPRSRLGGRLEPATRFRALVGEGRNLDIISQAEVVDSYSTLRGDLERMGQAAVVLELADRALAEREPHPEAFRLLAAALQLMAGGALPPAVAWFAARLLALTGHRPSLDRCAVCGKPIATACFWSRHLGGCIDQGCASRDPLSVPVGTATQAVLRFVLVAAPGALRRFSPPAPILAEAEELLLGYAEACFESRLRAPGVVRRLRCPPQRGGRRAEAQG